MSSCALTAGGTAPPCVAQVRERLTRGVLAGMHALHGERRLVPSLFQTVCEFMHRSLLEAGGGRREEGEARTSVALTYLGRLPLRRLLQLYAFLALRLADNVVRPLDLDRELQARWGAAWHLAGAGRWCWCWGAGCVRAPGRVTACSATALTKRCRRWRGRRASRRSARSVAASG